MLDSTTSDPLCCYGQNRLLGCSLISPCSTVVRSLRGFARHPALDNRPVGLRSTEVYTGWNLMR